MSKNAASANPRAFLRELRWMAPVSAVIAVAFAGLSWWEGHGFWSSLPGFGAALVVLLPLMWARWFPSGAELRSQRGLIALAVCVPWLVAGVGVFMVLS